MRRLHILFCIFIVSLFFIVCKLFYVQVFSSQKFSENNYLHTQIIKPTRGSIFDRNHEPLVTNEPTYVLFAEPKLVKSKYDLINRVDDVLKIGEATLEARLKMEKQWVRLASDVTDEQRTKLLKMNLKGIGFDEHSKRFYPEASIAAHLVGFVGKDQDGDNIGYAGLEGYYNKDLEGLPGILKTERDLSGRPIVIGTQNRLQGENGRDLELTIDKTTQLIIKERLKKGIERYQATGGCVTVMQPYTGEILGMSCLPDFDPDDYGSFDETYFRNPIISDTFEPGSIFKPLVVAAALNEGKVKEDDVFNEEGPIKMGKYLLRTWDNKYHGKLSVTEILQNSSNVGMVLIGRKLGDSSLVDYIDKYGFGERTNIDIQGEVPSYLRQKWHSVDYATATFGQGIAVTQIQMITAFASIINDGWLMQPYVVGSLLSDTGETDRVKPKKIRRVISKKTSEIVRRLLEATVKHGEAKWKIPKGYRIGGKTGTAQIAVQGAYDASKTNASFIGFAPVDKPQFLILVSLREPKTSPWASETSAPLFFEIAKDLFVHYNISGR